MTKATRFPASRSVRIVSGAPAIGRSPFQTTPSRSKAKRAKACARIIARASASSSFAPPSFGCYTAPLAEIAPFRGTRFDPSAVDDLSLVVAPPYDVITEADR